MGTRNLTMVQKDKRIRVAQYGQWDGYIEGVGAEIFEFVKNMLIENKEAEFAEKVVACKFIYRPTIEKYYEELGIDVSSGWIDMKDSNRFKAAHPTLDRDMGAGVLDYIMENSPCELRNDYEFINDSLFCEFAYLVNLDTRMLEIYVGGKNKIYEMPFETIRQIDKKIFVDTCNKAINPDKGE